MSIHEGLSKIRNLTQLTIEYTHVILSLFNIVLSNRCTWPSVFQSLDSTAQEFLILVIIYKFPSFH